MWQNLKNFKSWAIFPRLRMHCVFDFWWKCAPILWAHLLLCWKISWSVLEGAAFNVSVQMFHIQHWTKCMPEAGAGVGSCFQRNSWIPGWWRETAAQGTHFQPGVSLIMTSIVILKATGEPLCSHFNTPSAYYWYPLRHHMWDTTSSVKLSEGSCVISMALLHRW